MAASEFADVVTLSVIDGRSGVKIASLVDAELQEVREVITSLKTRNGCWCNPMISASAAPIHHSIECQRARALMEKLEVK